MFLKIENQITYYVTYTPLHNFAPIQIHILPWKGPISIQGNMRARHNGNF